MSRRTIALLFILLIIILIIYYIIPVEYRTPYLLTISTLYILTCITISFYRRRGWI